ncbi:IclR family transcriptional regulator [Lysinibacillus agricola]|uniref:IclR family transcriptional regulator n=1 Tax=Lysinibacillus agricola TaxID=2590012 RepID=A0ABX7ALE7_9BACI|nr:MULTISPECIES: IclR family transcriptional regulator [Lysinibacillus]KOS59852.1 IclR family transcriptional regulator [Lysinibacillus sp. FJAT-14222]QQP10629.1 IclR family transcriptional regulator [Lysinibacillus agricola]
MTLKTLDNSLEVLKYFNKQNPTWGVRELAKEMNISHSIIYRILSTFENHGFLIQNPETKKYELGLRFLEYGQMVKEKLNLSDFVLPIMKNLAEEIKESVFLTWLDGTDGVTVEIAESSQTIKFSVSIGTRTPLYIGASCKTIMAYLPEKRQMDIMDNGMEKLTSETITDPDEMLLDLENIRNQGWCFSTGEYSHSVFGLGVPLFNSKSDIIASLTIAGPEYRKPTEEKFLEMVKIIQHAAMNIQRYFDQYSFKFYND